MPEAVPEDSEPDSKVPGGQVTPIRPAGNNVVIFQVAVARPQVLGPTPSGANGEVANSQSPSRTSLATAENQQPQISAEDRPSQKVAEVAAGNPRHGPIDQVENERDSEPPVKSVEAEEAIGAPTEESQEVAPLMTRMERPTMEETATST